MLQAEAQMRAAMANEASAALAAGLDPNAVEGYVPRNSPAAMPAPQAKGTLQSARADTATARSSAPTSTEAGSVQSHLSASPAEQHDVPAHALPQIAQDNGKQSIGATSSSINKAGPSQARLNGAQHVSATPGSASGASCDSGGTEAPPQDRGKLASSTSDLGRHGAEGGLQQPAEGSQRKALANSAAAHDIDAEHVAAEGSASQSADPAQQPVLVCS